MDDFMFTVETKNTPIGSIIEAFWWLPWSVGHGGLYPSRVKKKVCKLQSSCIHWMSHECYNTVVSKLELGIYAFYVWNLIRTNLTIVLPGHSQQVCDLCRLVQPLPWRFPTEAYCRSDKLHIICKDTKPNCKSGWAIYGFFRWLQPYVANLRVQWKTWVTLLFICTKVFR